MNYTNGIIFLLFSFLIVSIIAKKHRRIGMLLIGAFLVRSVLVIIDELYYPMPGVGDGIFWDINATYWAKDGFIATFDHLETGHLLYVWMMSALYALFGHSTMMIKVINALFGTLIVLNVWKTAKLLTEDNRVARRIAGLAAFFPSLVFFSAVLLREVAIAYPLSLGTYFLVLWIKEKKAYMVFMASISFAVSMAFHSGAIAMILAVFVWTVLSMVKNIVNGRIAISIKQFFSVLFIGSMIYMLFATGFGMDKFRKFSQYETQELQGIQDSSSRGRAAYLEDLRAETPGELALQAPIRLAYFLFAPFPWMISAPSDVVGAIDAFLFLLIFILIVCRRRVVMSNPSAVLLLLLFGTMAVVFSLGVSNYGTAIRHRNKILPMYLVLIAAANSKVTSLRYSIGRGVSPGRRIN